MLAIPSDECGMGYSVAGDEGGSGDWMEVEYILYRLDNPRAGIGALAFDDRNHVRDFWLESAEIGIGATGRWSLCCLPDCLPVLVACGIGKDLVQATRLASLNRQRKSEQSSGQSRR